MPQCLTCLVLATTRDTRDKETICSLLLYCYMYHFLSHPICFYPFSYTKSLISLLIININILTINLFITMWSNAQKPVLFI